MNSADRLRILVVTRSYPALGDLYQYPFVHRRVLAYRRAGHSVAVFRPTGQAASSEHEFEGVTCTSGDREALSSFAEQWRPDVIAAHGLSEAQWPALSAVADRYPTCAWLHGSEIPEFARRKAMWDLRGEERTRALQVIDERRTFWRGLLDCPPARFRLVFVSEAAVAMFRQDLGDILQSPAAVIPNPIDTELFRYEPKPASQRMQVLMIRPFDSFGYGNDLAVSAIADLSRRSDFHDLRFTIIGDGPLFEQTLAPIRHFANVTVERGFMAQPRIAELHRTHGIFLVPTRLDTQGVSRDEAMSSGLVPVTNAIPAVSEYTDDECAMLAPPEEASALAAGISWLIEEPGLFDTMSAAAAARVRRQTGAALTVPRELALLAEAGGG